MQHACAEVISLEASEAVVHGLQRDEVELQIRRRQVRQRANKSPCFNHIRGQGPSAQEEIAQEIPWNSPRTERALEAEWARAGADHAHSEMVLQILPDTGKVARHGDSQRLKVL